MKRKNKRGHEESYFPKEHLKFPKLKEKFLNNKYLHKYQAIPRSPYPVEFRVSNLRHDTNLSNFQAILNDCGFKEPEVDNFPAKDLIWWSLAVSENDIADAEERFLCHVERTSYKPFLRKFTSSPAFRKSSRLGNFRFTFSIKELLAKYSNQFCGGKEPQIRIYETVVYRQEVMYAIVVHGPDGQREFEEFPLLRDSCNGVCLIHDGMIVWRPEGMSKTHAFRLSLGTEVQASRITRKKRQYYMWDHIAVAFHVPKGGIFHFQKKSLINHLSLCQGAKPKLNTEEFVKCEFESTAIFDPDQE